MAPPLSTYFDVPTFRAIDSDATNIQQPLSSALEAQLASSHAWLHERGAGAVARIGSPGAAGAAGINTLYQCSATWASLLVQPYLVTRGLTSLTVTYLGTIWGGDADVSLELQGFGVTNTIWVTGASPTSNETRSCTLVLDQPSTVEYETDLILWVRGRYLALETPGTDPVTYNEGTVLASTTTFTTSPNGALVGAGPDWSGTGFPIQVLRETLVRNPAGRDSTGAAAGVAVLSERVSGAEPAREVLIARLTPRSIFLEGRHT